jgi:hypothetical protein
MKQSHFGRYVLPFAQWYIFMIFTAIAFDYFLHRFQLVFVGRYLGFVGTVLIVISFLYSLRKRRLVKSGSPKKLLAMHEYLAWSGSILLLVHAGIHFNAILPWLAVFMLLVNVASGLVGKFLLKDANEALVAKRKEMADSGLGISETDKILFWDSIAVDMMKKWRVVHMPISLLFVLFALLHIFTIIMYSK